MSDTSGAGAAGNTAPAPPRGKRPAAGSGRTEVRVPAALPWLGPALVLIAAVVFYPAAELVRASMSDYSITGLLKGSAGLSNYAKVLAHPDLGTVLVNTVVWVVAVLVLSLVISLGLAQLLSKEFFGRKVVRWAVIIPWAASLVITARLFTLLLDYNYGIVNRFLIAIGILDTPIDFLGDDRWTMP